jgi:hypothetical protein
MTSSETTWIRVSRSEPCPVCDRPDYCTRTTDGLAVKCMRVESNQPAKKGPGWIHHMTDPLPPRPPAKKIEKKADWTAECKKMFEHDKAHDKRCEVADLLKVSVESLEALRVGIGWDEWNSREFSAWPSRDSDGRCIGYVRRYSDGTKRTNQGGTTGVFYVPTWYTHPGPVFVVEGGSDVAACESHNLNCIGRASNTYGGHWIKKMIRQCCPEKLIVVVGERDQNLDRRGTVASCTTNCAGCAFCWPGYYGMKKVAAELGRRAVGVLVPPSSKDMRELLTGDKCWLELLGAL